MSRSFEHIVMILELRATTVFITHISTAVQVIGVGQEGHIFIGPWGHFNRQLPLTVRTTDPVPGDRRTIW